MLPQPLKDVHIPRIWECVTLHGKKELRFLIDCPWNGEIILDYLTGPNVITNVLKSRRGKQNNRSDDVIWEEPDPLLLVLKIEEAGRSQGIWACLEAERGKKVDFLSAPESPERNTTLPTPWFLASKILIVPVNYRTVRCGIINLCCFKVLSCGILLKQQ